MPSNLRIMLRSPSPPNAQERCIKVEPPYFLAPTSSVPICREGSERQASDSSSFCRTPDSGASYTHNPYGFDGIPFLPSLQCASGNTLTTEISTEPLLHIGAGAAAQRCRRVSESGSSCCRTPDSAAYTHNPYSFDGMAHPPSPRLSLVQSPFVGSPMPEFPSDPPCGFPGAAHSGMGAELCPPTHRPRQFPAFPTPSVPPANDPSALPPTGRQLTSPCPSILPGPPAHPCCPHPKPWQRVRGKRGLTTYVCRDCGTKWRVVSPGRVAAKGADGAY
eukprot:EG_transcript_21034